MLLSGSSPGSEVLSGALPIPRAEPWASLGAGIWGLIPAQAAPAAPDSFAPFSSSGKLFLLPTEPDPPQASPGWECWCSPRSEVFPQPHSELNNAQGRHFDHLRSQIPGDIFLPGLGSPGSLSGKPRHGKKKTKSHPWCSFLALGRRHLCSWHRALPARQGPVQSCPCHRGQ